MKKIKLSFIIGTSAILLAHSCQQPKVDQAAIDAKVSELYNEEKVKVENDAATECEAVIASQVKAIQDSLSAMTASQQAELLAKTQKELKIAQAKADADKKKRAISDAKAKPSGPKKPATVDQKLDDRFSGKTDAKQAKEIDNKLDDRFGKTNVQQTVEEKKEVDKKLDDRFK
jgi:hypothetical protein